MAIGESAGLLFKIKGDASDAIRAFRDTENAADGLTVGATSLTKTFSSLAGPALIAGAAIAAVGVAAIAGVKAIYDLSKSTAEFGSTIFDASQKTGLGAERLSAMKFAADQSGTSLDAVTAATARFSKVLGDAANGSEQAEAKLKRLGVTSTDLDTALKQALATIVKVPPGAQQMALAMDAFGKSGADLLPFIKSFDGDLDALTEKAKKLGVTITDEAAAAADEFGDQLDTLNAQFDGIGRTIGTAFMGPFNDMARALSDFLTQNQDAIKRWGTNAADVIRGVGVVMRDLDRQSQESTGSSAAAWAGWSVRMLAYLDPVQYALIRTVERLREVGAASKGASAGLGAFLSPALGAAPDAPTGGASRRRSGGGRAPVDNSERDAERLARRDLAAQIKIEANNLKTVQEEMAKAYAALRATLAQGSAVQAFTDATNTATQQWASNLHDALKVLEELERQAITNDATEHERALLLQTQEERRHKLKLAMDAEIKKNEDEAWEERLKRGEIEAERAQEQFNLEQERFEKRQEWLNSLGGGLTVLKPDIGGPEGGGPFDAWTSSWEGFFNRITEEAPTLSSTLQSLAETFQNAFVGMANALGSVVQQWVLYGNTGPAVMRKVLAAALASIAAEAAVKAIYAAAWGFILLAQHDWVGAGNAFASAALFGAVAGAAAIAGRLVAGNAFKQQTSTATGQSSSSSSGGNRGEGQGQGYSGQEGVVSEHGRNAPMIRSDVYLHITGDEDGLAKLFRAAIQNNGSIRTDIRGLADA